MKYLCPAIPMSKAKPKSDPSPVLDSVSEEEQASSDSSDGIDGESLDEAIAKLTPEQTEIFMRALAHTMRKRRLMLMGNLLALLVMVFGMVFAFFSYSNREPGSFAGWVFLIPFGGAGFCMWLFGTLAKRSGIQTHKALIQDSPFDLSEHENTKGNS